MLQAICHSECSDWYKWDSRPVSTFTDSNSAIFKDQFLQLINFFICLVCRWTTQVLSAFIRGHTTFEFGKRLKNFKFFSFSSLPKLLSTSWKFAKYLSASFKQNIKNTLPSQVCCFLGMPKSRMEQHHQQSCATALFQDSSVYTPFRKSSC
jgi:hypothetical protein